MAIGNGDAKPASKELRTTAREMGITWNNFHLILRHLARCVAVLMFKKRPFLANFQDNYPENPQGSPVCQAGISNEGRSSSTAIGLSNDCKWVFNEMFPTPWCHAVVHFELKMSCFSANFLEDHPENPGRLPVSQASVSNEGYSSSMAISYALCKTRAQLGPSRKSSFCACVCVCLCAAQRHLYCTPNHQFAKA